MTIEKDKIVTIDYILKDKEGEILDDSQEMGPLEYMHGRGDIIPGLEKALDGKQQGEQFSVTIEAADAYGEYDQTLVVEVPRTQFPADADITEGMQFEAESSQGSQVVTVKTVTDSVVTVDANHPLAGEQLFFDITIKNIRDASAEELVKGLNHGCGCGDNCGDDDCDGNCGCGGSCGGCGN